MKISRKRKKKERSKEYVPRIFHLRNLLIDNIYESYC